MSYGGVFYSLTDDQLQRIIAGSLDGESFLQGSSAEKPADCYSEGELFWYELAKILHTENGCGADITEAVPESGAYSYSEDVQRTADALTRLSKEEVRRRHEQLVTGFSYEAVYKAILGLSFFYKRAQRAGHAMLFNIR